MLALRKLRNHLKRLTRESRQQPMTNPGQANLGKRWIYGGRRCGENMASSSTRTRLLAGGKPDFTSSFFFSRRSHSECRPELDELHLQSAQHRVLAWPFGALVPASPCLRPLTAKSFFVKTKMASSNMLAVHLNYR